MSLALALLCSTLTTATAEPVERAPSVLVWNLDADEQVPPAVTAAMATELVLALRDGGSFGRVLAQSDVADLVERTPAPTRDVCVECILALEDALKIDRVVVGRLRRVGALWSLELKLLDVHNASVLAATHELSTDPLETLVKGMRRRAARLLLEQTRLALRDALDIGLSEAPAAAPAPPAPPAAPPASTSTETPVPSRREPPAPVQ